MLNWRPMVSSIPSKVNWLSGESLWVAVAEGTGRAATAENAKVNMALYNPDLYPTTWLPDYAPTVFQRHAAREFARSNLNLGGR